jgi:hypothetical protein
MKMKITDLESWLSWAWNGCHMVPHCVWHDIGISVLLCVCTSMNLVFFSVRFQCSIHDGTQPGVVFLDFTSSNVPALFTGSSFHCVCPWFPLISRDQRRPWCKHTANYSTLLSRVHFPTLLNPSPNKLHCTSAKDAMCLLLYYSLMQTQKFGVINSNAAPRAQHFLTLHAN